MMDEARNEREAFYIHSLIEFYGGKLNEKYRVILDMPCGHGRLHRYLRVMAMMCMVWIFRRS